MIFFNTLSIIKEELINTKNKLKEQLQINKNLNLEKETLIKENTKNLNKILELEKNQLILNEEKQNNLTKSTNEIKELKEQIQKLQEEIDSINNNYKLDIDTKIQIIEKLNAENSDIKQNLDNLNKSTEKIIQVLAYAFMYEEMAFEQQMEAGIISFKNLKSGFLPFTFKSPPKVGNKSSITASI